MCLLIGPSPVRDLTVTPFGTTTLLISWSRPIASGSADGLLSYSISLNGEQNATVNDTEVEKVGLTANTPYEIQVCIVLV